MVSMNNAKPRKDFTKKILKCANAYLLKYTGVEYKISLNRRLTEATISAIMKIEEKTFRPELRYTHEELLGRMERDFFFLLMVYASGNPVGFAMGYKDPEDSSSFYLDTLATVVQGKEIGSTLLRLVAIICFEQGFRHVTIRTEEYDELGRSPKSFYEKWDFYTIACDPSEGIGMKKDLDKQTVSKYVQRFCGQTL